MTNTDEITNQLKSLLETLRACDDPHRATAEWKQAFNLLKKTDLPANTVANVVAMRGVERLEELIETLAGPPETAEEDRPDAETCRAALVAFRKRLKLTRLDDESRIDSRNHLSKGQASEINCITPPVEWPVEVWRELARQGKLRALGKGFYELAE